MNKTIIVKIQFPQQCIAICLSYGKSNIVKLNSCPQQRMQQRQQGNNFQGNQIEFCKSNIFLTGQYSTTMVLICAQSKRWFFGVCIEIGYKIMIAFLPGDVVFQTRMQVLFVGKNQPIHPIMYLKFGIIQVKKYSCLRLQNFIKFRCDHNILK